MQINYGICGFPVSWNPHYIINFPKFKWPIIRVLIRGVKWDQFNFRGGGRVNTFWEISLDLVLMSQMRSTGMSGCCVAWYQRQELTSTFDSMTVARSKMEGCFSGGMRRMLIGKIHCSIILYTTSYPTTSTMNWCYTRTAMPKWRVSMFTYMAVSHLWVTIADYNPSRR